MAIININIQQKPNIPPTANAGNDSSINQPASTITLNGSGSDTDGIIVSYNWTQLSGPACSIVNPNSATTNVTGMTTIGNYTFQLMVTDNQGGIGVDSVTKTVAASLTYPFKWIPDQTTCEIQYDINTGGLLVVDIYDNSDLNLIGFIDNIEVSTYRQPVYKGSNFLPNSSTPPADCWMLASDLVTGGGSLDWRFIFNLPRYLTYYPSQETFVFKIKGRSTVGTGVMNGLYSLKSASAGAMTMGGSPGSYIPGTTIETTPLITTNYSGKPFVGGGDNTYNYANGADILIFTYTRSTKTLVLS